MHRRPGAPGCLLVVAVALALGAVAQSQAGAAAGSSSDEAAGAQRSLVVAASVDSPHAVQGRKSTPSTPSILERLPSPQAREAYCDAEFADLFSSVPSELRRWKEAGISLQLMQETIRAHTLRSSTSMRKGFVAGFRKGRAVLPDKPMLKEDMAHHAALFFLYMQALVDVEQLFGDLVPDSDFVISTVDRPMLLAYEGRRSATPQPVMRFCKTPAHSDIPVPIFHFYMAHHNNDLSGMVDEINARYPWHQRKPVLFGRLSKYARHLHPKDPYAQRLGLNGTNICDTASGSVRACLVREHFMDFSHGYPGLMDVASNPRLSMKDHAQFKYLVHLDGQGLSSRLDQLLPLGSTIFKEESGYYGFYHHLLKPYVHYVPFWKKGPEEILDALLWAREHDQEAQRVGEEAQKLAAKYLSRDARACYWLKLLKEYGKLMTYEPAKAAGERYMRYNLHVQEYLETEAVAWEAGGQLRRYPFAP